MAGKLLGLLASIWKRKFLLLIILVLLGGVSYYGYKKNAIVDSTESIQTASVARGTVTITITGTGQVQAKNQVDLKGVAAGDGIEVMEVLVKNDQEVKKGDLIAVLDTTELMKKVRNAQLDLQSAQIALKETKKNNSTKTVEDKWTRQKQEISVSQKANSLADIYDNLDDYKIKAPFDGIVTGLSVSAGDSVSQSDVIASVITKEMHAEISLNEMDAVKVKVGNEVKLTMDALPGVTMRGKISKIDTIGVVTQNVVSYKAEIDFENTSQLIKPGMSVNAEVAIDSRENVLTVPSLAIKTDADGSFYVEVLDESANNSLAKTNSSNQAGENLPTYKIIKRTIQTGLTNDVVTEVTSGLKEGEKIITKSSASSVKSNSTSNTSSSRNSGSSSFRLPGLGGGGLH